MAITLKTLRLNFITLKLLECLFTGVNGPGSLAILDNPDGLGILWSKFFFFFVIEQDDLHFNLYEF